MKTPAIFEMCSIIFALAGTYFWIRSVSWQSAESIADQAMTSLGFNKTTARNLASQATDAKISFLLLFIAFLLQDAALVFSQGLTRIMRVIYFFIPPVVAIFIYLIANKISRCRSNKIYEQAVKLQKK